MDVIDFCDNHSCNKMSENSVFHDKSKHIEIRYHYIQDMVQRGVVQFQSVPIEEQFVDVLTKPLSRIEFEYFRDNLVYYESTSVIRGSDDDDVVSCSNGAVAWSRIGMST